MNKAKKTLKAKDVEEDNNIVVSFNMDQPNIAIYDLIEKVVSPIVDAITLPAINIESKKGRVTWSPLKVDLPRNEWEMLKSYSLEHIYMFAIRSMTIAATQHIKAFHDKESKVDKLPTSMSEAIRPQTRVQRRTEVDVIVEFLASKGMTLDDDGKVVPVTT